MITPFLRQKFGVGALLDDAPSLDDQMRSAMRTVGKRCEMTIDVRPLVSSRKRGEDGVLGFGVERCGWLAEDEDVGLLAA